MKGEYDAKTKNIEGKYFTTADYNRFTSDTWIKDKTKNWSINVIFLIS